MHRAWDKAVQLLKVLQVRERGGGGVGVGMGVGAGLRGGRRWSHLHTHTQSSLLALGSMPAHLHPIIGTYWAHPAHTPTHPPTLTPHTPKHPHTAPRPPGPRPSAARLRPACGARGNGAGCRMDRRIQRTAGGVEGGRGGFGGWGWVGSREGAEYGVDMVARTHPHTYVYTHICIQTHTHTHTPARPLTRARTHATPSPLSPPTPSHPAAAVQMLCSPLLPGSVSGAGGLLDELVGGLKVRVLCVCVLCMCAHACVCVCVCLCVFVCACACA